jgi:hypothetical protein
VNDTSTTFQRLVQLRASGRYMFRPRSRGRYLLDGPQTLGYLSHSRPYISHLRIYILLLYYPISYTFFQYFSQCTCITRLAKTNCCCSGSSRLPTSRGVVVQTDPVCIATLDSVCSTPLRMITSYCCNPPLFLRSHCSV